MNLAWLFDHGVRARARGVGESCETCRHFIDYRDIGDDSDASDGYCGHPDHRDPWKSPHWKYGGHWTHSTSWCAWWQAKE